MSMRRPSLALRMLQAICADTSTSPRSFLASLRRRVRAGVSLRDGNLMHFFRLLTDKKSFSEVSGRAGLLVLAKKHLLAAALVCGGALL